MHQAFHFLVIRLITQACFNSPIFMNIDLELLYRNSNRQYIFFKKNILSCHSNSFDPLIPVRISVEMEPFILLS